MRKIISRLFFVAFVYCGQAQNENTKWYFGLHVGLDFMTNPPSIINNSAMHAGEGCSSIADTAGNTLFYTNGITVWNKQNNVMANGAGLLGDLSSTQSALIIKLPYSANLYYIFTAAAWGGTTGISYSIVDMNLAAGMGSVTVKNAPLFKNYCTEQLTAVKHANGVDFWIMTHELVTNNFRAYLFSAVGISTVAVVSSAGTPHNQYVGSMKCSPSGQKLASVLMNYLVELYDFDNSTGIVSNPLRLEGSGYGCEFSPDGTKFYCTQWDGDNNHNSTIKQWDLNNLVLPAVYVYNVSVSVILPNYGLTTDIGFRALQLAPDNKIYVARRTFQSIGVINNPDAAGAACNFVSAGQVISVATPTNSAYSIFGLPSMKVSAPPPLCPYSFTVQSGNILCGVGMSSPSIIVSGNPTGNLNYHWTNGITTYSTAQVDTLSGSWQVSVSDSSGCSVSNWFTVPKTPVYPLFNGLTNQNHNINRCMGSSVALSVIGGVTYTWNTGAQGQSITVSPTTTTQYYVTSTDQYGCIATSQMSVMVHIFPVPSFSVNCSPDTICGGTKTLTIYGYSDTTAFYNWYQYYYNYQTGNYSYSITPITIVVTPTTTTAYSASASNGKCQFYQVLTIRSQSINVTASKSNICANETFTLTANGINSYSWSTGDTSSFIVQTLQTSKTYTVSGIDANGCSSLKITSVAINPLPTIRIATIQPFCSGETTTLTASGASTYTWSTLQTGASIIITPPVTIIHNVRGTDERGCENNNQILVPVSPCTSLDELKIINDKLKIYPTPNNGKFIIETPTENHMTITDVSGKIVFEKQLPSGTHNIDLSNFSNGIYFVKSSNGNHKKIVKVE
ncbi:MAG: T9SS type A sorting domain-containing protein [Bacteroidetes bacterium]|nr:T9SS type A sorting domain-containing protein [Bacteroidota bacterium]